MALIIFACFCSMFACFIIFYYHQFQYWRKLGVPHTNPRTIFGDIAKISFVKSAGEVIKDLYDKGENLRYFGVWFWYHPALIIRDPELIKCVLIRDFAHFHDRGAFINSRKDPLSAHIFNLPGARWRTIRPKVTPGFTTGRMKAILPKCILCAENLCRVLDQIACSTGIAEMRELTARYTTDVTTAYFLGIDSQAVVNSTSTWRTMGRKVFEPTIINLMRSIVPVFIPSLAKAANITTTNRTVLTFFLEYIRRLIKVREASNEYLDFFQFIVNLTKIQKIPIVKKNLYLDCKRNFLKFTYAEAAAQSFLFFIAGFETSSLTLSYALLELALNQDIQDKVRDEIKNMHAKHDGNVSYESLNEMEYLNKVCEETLRKWPVVPVILRECTKSYKLPESDIILPKGTSVQISVFGIHRDPKFYPDPEKFDPERFTEEEKAKRHSFSYIPFGGGPRHCIGMRLSIIQKKVALICLLSKFKFRVCSETPLDRPIHPNSFFFAPTNGMHLQVLKLENE